MKIINTQNLSAFSTISMSIEQRFLEVKKPLLWIEPSINMIHLDTVKSFVFGSPLAAIGCATYLLEHSLRMAIWDPSASGSSRKKPSTVILNATLGNLLNSQEYSPTISILLPDSTDLHWWKAVTRAVRNKVNHVDIPSIFHIAKELQYEYDYAYSGFDGPNSWKSEDPHSWGMFWHRYGDKLASDFIVQATDQVDRLIKNTQWKPDESWWISQKFEYDAFFRESWNFESLQKSINRVYDSTPANVTNAE